jgi:hypothetical protein
MTMFTFLFVSGWCLLLVLHIVGKFWQNALEIHSVADNLDKARDVPARGHQAINDSVRNAHGQVGWNPRPPKYCHVW